MIRAVDCIISQMIQAIGCNNRLRYMLTEVKSAVDPIMKL